MDDNTPEPKGILGLATKITKPLPLAALSILAFVVIVLWLIAANSTNPLFKQVMNFLFIIVLVVVVLAFVAYLLTESWKRKPQAQPAAGTMVLAGNVYYPGDAAAPGATITADGVMGNTTSDANGYFTLQVYPRDEYTVRAVLNGWAGKITVKRRQAEKPVIITLAQAGAPVSPARPPVTTTPPAPPPVTTAPGGFPPDAAGPSHQEFVQLFTFMKDKFTLKELRELVQVEMNVNPETISGGTISEYALELASYAKRRGQFNELRAAVKRARPNLAW